MILKSYLNSPGFSFLLCEIVHISSRKLKKLKRNGVHDITGFSKEHVQHLVISRVRVGAHLLSNPLYWARI